MRKPCWAKPESCGHLLRIHTQQVLSERAKPIVRSGLTYDDLAAELSMYSIIVISIVTIILILIILVINIVVVFIAMTNVASLCNLTGKVGYYLGAYSLSKQRGGATGSVKPYAQV